MARVELLVTVDKVVSSNLQPVSGASVLVKQRSTGSPVTIYAAETGGTTVSNPLATDSDGRVNGWVNEDSLILTISGSGITSYNQPYEAVRGDSLLTTAAAIVTLATTVNTLSVDVSASKFDIGDLKSSARSTPAAGWLLCDGAAVSRTVTYAALFAAIGTAYGAGNGSTTFNIPDLRGRVPVGVDGAANRLPSSTPNTTIGKSGGEEKHTLVTSEIPAHGHPPGALSSFVVCNGNVTPWSAYSPGSLPNVPAMGAGGNFIDTSSTGQQGGGTSHYNVQPYQVVNWFIKAV